MQELPKIDMLSPTMRLEALQRFGENPTPVSISELPVFNMQKATLAREYANSVVHSTPERNFDALRTAVALSVYNFLCTSPNTPPDSRQIILPPQLLHQLKKLAREEVHFTAYERGILPTIGVEIELPGKALKKIPDNKKESFYESYEEFCSVVGIPWNKSSYYLSDNSLSIEIGTSPSYSAAVQRRIIEELIKGRFIPHLKESQTPDDIFEHLDRSLVSLHINFARDYVGTKILEEDMEILETLLALSFTSYKRLLNKKSVWLDIKNDALCLSNPTRGTSRYEFKSHEIGTSNVFRLLTYAQLLMGDLLASRTAGTRLTQQLSQEWKKLRSEILEIYQQFNISTVSQKNLFNQPKLVFFANNPEIKSNFRDIAHRYSIKTRSLISIREE